MFKFLIKYHFKNLFLFSLLIIITACNNTSKTKFKEHTPKSSGITFNNALVLNEELSVLEFEYMYNGAGVAVADFDKDGLQDIYFTGNMVSNRLYRNLGNWKFEDLTESAKVNSTSWSNGVAIVDINQDTYPDIYVCRGGPRGSSGANRANLLFINDGMKNGQLSFSEAAEKWGLADQSYSVQSTFFDYDGDGDLDMYLLSNALVDFNRNTSRPKDRTGKAPSADKLFRNNGDQTYSDVSASSGILIEGFGLGVEVCDMNQDGWPDIYVSNDFLTDDLLYINQKDGTFINEVNNYFQHLTFNGMGNDIADINNDGLMDVVVLDMLPPDNRRWKLTMMGNNYDEYTNARSMGYHPQYIRNTLQLNNGNGTFSEIGQIAGVAATEWSWASLFLDFDHDGLKDLFITNGYRQDITNLDFMVYGNRVLTMGTEEANRKQRIEQLNKLPGIKIQNFAYKNSGNLQFEDVSKAAGFTKQTYSNGMAYADLDNDGDLDLVINNIDDPAGLFENQTELTPSSNYIKFKFKGEAPNLEGLGSQVEIYHDGNIQKQYFTPYRGYLSTVEKTIHFGLGTSTQIDSIIVTWPNGNIQIQRMVEANQQITLSQNDAKTKSKKVSNQIATLFQAVDTSAFPGFTHREDEFVDFKIQPLLPHMHSRNGPGLAVGDVNGDQLDDVFIGGAAGQNGALILQQADGQFYKKDFLDSQQEDMGALLFDADNDGDQDLYVVSGGASFQDGDTLYQDRLYQNDGSGNFEKTNALPKFNHSGSVVTAADYDKDGRLDLFVGGRIRPGEYPLPPASVLLKNNSSKTEIKFEIDQQKINTTFKELGMVSSAVWTDFNNDTWLDLIVVGEFMSIHFFENEKGQLREVSKETGLSNTHGWWNSITAGDFDNDGDSDYVLGNLGLNTRFKASAKEPLCIYANDYDKNGLIDPVMCYYNNGENYIAHSRNDLIEQINAMRARFRTYEDYANATFEKSFLKDELDNAHVVKSETFANAYLENLSNGKFALHELPIKAQIAPIYGMLIDDFNQDGNLDIQAVGNFFSGEVFTGRYDAAIGWILAGDGHGQFKSLDVKETGFFVPGDAKSLVNLFSGEKELSMVGLNNEDVKVYERTRVERKSYTPKPKDIAAIIQYKDGRKQKVEFSLGTGYLSQKSRKISIPLEASTVLILDRDGNQTELK